MAAEGKPGGRPYCGEQRDKKIHRVLAFNHGYLSALVLYKAHPDVYEAHEIYDVYFKKYDMNSFSQPRVLIKSLNKALC